MRAGGKQTPTLARRWLRRLRTLIWTSLSIVTLLAAVLVGVGKLLMPYSAQYQPRLEAWLAREFNQPVRVESFAGEWKAFGPRISLEGLQLLGGPGDEGAIALRRAALDIKPLNALIPGRPLYSFRIIGADLVLTRSPEGRFELSGLGVNRLRAGPGAAPNDSAGLANLARVGELRLEQSTLSLRDQALGMGLRLAGMDGRLQLKQDRIALKLRASLTELDSRRVLGDLGATVLIHLDRQRRLAGASWHLESGELLVAELARQFPDHLLKPVAGRVNAQLWGSWSPGAQQVMEGVLDIRDAALGPEDRRVRVDRLNSRFRWRMEGRRTWRLDLADMRIEEQSRNWQTPRLSVERHIAGGVGIWVSADRLEASFPLALTQLIVAGSNGSWPRGAPTAGAGSITDFDLIINADKKLAAVSGVGDDVAVTEWGRWPALAGLSGSVDLHYGQGEARLSGPAVRIDWPRNFRAPLQVEVAACRLEILWGTRSQVDARDCVLRNRDLDLRANGLFVRNEGKPHVDINVAGPRMDLGKLHDYWPESVIKPKVTAWLQRAIEAGVARQVRFSLFGDMDDFPFPGGQGRLEAAFEFAEGRLAYQAGWPRALGVEARAHFLNQAMSVDGSIADLGGVGVDSVRARVADFTAARLNLGWETTARLPALAGFLESTPLLDAAGPDLDRFQFDGAAKTSGSLLLPLGAAGGATPGASSGGTARDLELAGELRLEGSGFVERTSDFALDDLSGVIEFDRQGFAGSNLEATYLGRPAQLDLTALWEAPEPFRAELRSSQPIGDLAAGLAGRAWSLGDLLDGEAEWRATLSVRSGSDGEDATRLTVRSDLVGVRSRLPEPLAKAPNEAWPMELTYPLTGEVALLEARFPERLELRLELARAGRNLPGQAPRGSGLNPGGPQPDASTPREQETTPGSGPGLAVATGSKDPPPLSVQRGVLQLGAEPAMLPPAGYFSLHGQASRLDLDGWLRILADFAEPLASAHGLKLSEAELETGELLLLNRLFEDVRMSLDQRDQELKAFFAAEELDGTVRFVRADTGERSLIAQFERLVLDRPQAEGMAMEGNPAELPEMHFYVRDLEYLGLQLGEASLEAYPVADGLRIDLLRSVSDQMTLEARGDWLGDAQTSRSDFDIVMTSESLGALIDALELSSVLEGGQTMVRYNAWWPGPPAAFELAQLNGEMSFSVIDGRLLNADPGAGRVLGLLSVGALPRRLAFDFRDVFSTGFGFDRAQGTLQLESGSAYTDDTVLESTAATLAIQGTSDLVRQEFDYRLSIRPGVSQALPVIGALAAGPPGAAAGLALQGLLRNALGDAAEARYSITGPWNDPVVERLEAPPRVGGELAGPPIAELPPTPDQP